MEKNMGQFSKKWEDLNFSDNYIFCKVMRNESLCKEMQFHIMTNVIIFFIIPVDMQR